MHPVGPSNNIYTSKLFKEVKEINVLKQKKCMYRLYTTGSCRDNKHYGSWPKPCYTYVRAYEKFDYSSTAEYYPGSTKANCMPASTSIKFTFLPIINQVNNIYLIIYLYIKHFMLTL